jgi:crotonobetaine/carnitine-CoA ligase
MTVGELLDRAAFLDPDNTYLYFLDQKVSFREFRNQTLRAATLFRDLGVQREDRVCLFLPNCPEFLYAWMGLSRIGAICVPINPAYKAGEGAFILNSCEAGVLLAHHSLKGVAQEMCRLSPTIGKLLVVGENKQSPPGLLDFCQELRKRLPLSEPEEVTPQDISMLMFTSGTTGRPKGVMVTHEMYVAAGQGYATWVEATSQDRFFTCLPLSHGNAQYYSTMGSLAVGASLILEERFSASRFWDQVRESEATVVNFIGMMLPVLMKQPKDASKASSRLRVCYGSPAFSPEVLAEFEKRFSTNVLIGYGLTECCYGTIERLGHNRRPRSSGLARWHPDSRFKNEVRVVDERNMPLAAGEVGEILLCNPAVTPGYWRDEEQTKAALRGGWFHTGDLGRLDEEGYLYFQDRKKDVIRRRGENISSLEVEEVLKREPRILDCAVIGVPSELAEEEVKAFVVIRPGEQMKPEEVVHWCAERLARFKVPRYVEFRVELPRTPSLRVRKDLLRQDPAGLHNDCFDREKAEIHPR